MPGSPTDDPTASDGLPNSGMTESADTTPGGIPGRVLSRNSFFGGKVVGESAS